MERISYSIVFCITGLTAFLPALIFGDAAYSASEEPKALPALKTSNPPKIDGSWMMPAGRTLQRRRTLQTLLWEHLQKTRRSLGFSMMRNPSTLRFTPLTRNPT